MNKLVSIIVPVFNAEKYLCKCIESLLAQTYRTVEIILINDGSRDKSGELCERYSSENKNIIVKHLENSGVGNARNVGLGIASGEYIAFCDSDDFVDIEYIEFLVRGIELFDVDLSVCSFKRVNKETDYREVKKNEYWSVLEKDSRYKFVFEKYKFSGYLWNKLFKKSIISLNNISFLKNVSILEDEAFVIKYLSCCRKVVFSNCELYAYRENLNSITNEGLTERRLSMIRGREYINDIINKSDCGTEIKKLSWNILMRLYCSFYRKICLKKINNKRYWKEHIYVGFRNQVKGYLLDSKWGKKDKMTYRYLRLYSNIKNYNSRGNIL